MIRWKTLHDTLEDTSEKSIYVARRTQGCCIPYHYRYLLSMSMVSRRSIFYISLIAFHTRCGTSYCGISHHNEPRNVNFYTYYLFRTAADAFRQDYERSNRPFYAALLLSFIWSFYNKTPFLIVRSSKLALQVSHLHHSISSLEVFD